MHSILVLTSTYPRWTHDVEPAFVHYLNQQLASQFRIIVLAPHYPGSSRNEEMDGIEIYRFRYFFQRAERLAYAGGILPNLRKNPLKIMLVPFFLIGQLASIGKLCRKHRIGLIHAHWIIPQGLLAIVARKLRLIPRTTAVICTSHGGDLFALRGSTLQTLKRFVVCNADHVTVVSTAMREHLCSIGCSNANVTVLPMGVDLYSRFVPGTDTDRKFDLVFVGRLVEKKGVATLIDSLPALVENFPGLRLAVVGDGPERQRLEDRTRKLGMTQCVVFAGAIPNAQVPEYYRSARIAVIPSVIAADGDREGLGLVAVEALGCGCVPVVSDLPALQDVVENRSNGLVFHAGNAIDLAAKIRQLLDDTELYNFLVRNGRKSVLDKFDWHKVGSRYRDVVARTVSGKEAP